MQEIVMVEEESMNLQQEISMMKESAEEDSSEENPYNNSWREGTKSQVKKTMKQEVAQLRIDLKEADTEN